MLLSSKEIEEFIQDIINKYRSKIEVQDYYLSPEGDKLHPNTMDNLSIIEKMIYNYVLRKIIIEKTNNE